ncbi:sulfatase [Nocardioides sp. TF02-7]|uniref:sulfatase family protein n=1 Tax=Nocardioides sp. TF02-7 TaxID=2917724 RepID=UPI001F061DEB|nr:sulfatase [Nocardioides sp. TF02-7]UMG92661.1 sulfatase [Nocardioides sp. TF02-7]
MRRPARLLPLAALLVLLLTATSTPVAGPPAGALTGGARAAAAPGPDRPDQPNIVLILTDDMRYGDLAFMPRTRRLLGRAGATYTRAISPHPMCCPARAELVTGQYGHNNGVRHNRGPWGGFPALKAKDNTIARWLAAAGYRTFYTGKYLNGYEETSRPRPDGWTRWDPTVEGVYGYGLLSPLGFANGDVTTGRYITHVLGDRTGEAIRAFSDTDDPFLLFVNHLAPHDTIAVHDGHRRPLPEAKYRGIHRTTRPDAAGKPSYAETQVADLPADMRALTRSFDRREVPALFRDRLRALRSVDDAVARTVRQLADAGELSDTYVVFTSDNGYLLGEHSRVGKNSVYQEALRVPLLVRGPGITPGTVHREPVTLLDLVRSMVGWADARPGRRLDGLGLEQATGARTRRDTILVLTGDEKRDSTPGLAYRGVVTRRYTYAVHAGDPSTGVLFDRERDPLRAAQPVPRPCLRRGPPRAAAPHRRAVELLRRARLQPGLRAAAGAPARLSGTCGWDAPGG